MFGRHSISVLDESWQVQWPQADHSRSAMPSQLAAGASRAASNKLQCKESHTILSIVVRACLMHPYSAHMVLDVNRLAFYDSVWLPFPGEDITRIW